MSRGCVGVTSGLFLAAARLAAAEPQHSFGESPTAMLNAFTVGLGGTFQPDSCVEHSRTLSAPCWCEFRSWASEKKKKKSIISCFYKLLRHSFAAVRTRCALWKQGVSGNTLPEDIRGTRWHTLTYWTHFITNKMALNNKKNYSLTSLSINACFSVGMLGS